MNTPRSVPLCLLSCLCLSLRHCYTYSPTLTSHAHIHRVEGWCRRQPQSLESRGVVKKCCSPPFPLLQTLQLPFPANIITNEKSHSSSNAVPPWEALPCPLHSALLKITLMRISCSSSWLEVPQLWWHLLKIQTESLQYQRLEKWRQWYILFSKFS